MGVPHTELSTFSDTPPWVHSPTEQISSQNGIRVANQQTTDKSTLIYACIQDCWGLFKCRVTIRVSLIHIIPCFLHLNDSVPTKCEVIQALYIYIYSIYVDVLFF